MTLPTCGVTPPYALPALRVPPPPPMRGRGRGRATVSQSVAVATAQANMLPAAQLFIVPCHVASSYGKVMEQQNPFAFFAHAARSQPPHRALNLADPLHHAVEYCI